MKHTEKYKLKITNTINYMSRVEFRDSGKLLLSNWFANKDLAEYIVKTANAYPEIIEMLMVALNYLPSTQTEDSEQNYDKIVKLLEKLGEM